MTHHHFGHPTTEIAGRTHFADTGEALPAVTSDGRCVHPRAALLHRLPGLLDEGGPDPARLGRPVRRCWAACCGHGVSEPYVLLEGGRRLAGDEARAWLRGRHAD